MMISPTELQFMYGNEYYGLPGFFAINMRTLKVHALIPGQWIPVTYDNVKRYLSYQQIQTRGDGIKDRDRILLDTAP